MFGAGLFARPAIHALSRRGITPSCIVDNSKAKQGSKIMGIPVLAPLEGLGSCPDAKVIITAAPKYIGEILSQTQAMGWTSVYDCSSLLASFEYDRETFESGVSQLHFDLDSYFYDYFNLYYPEKLILPSLDVVITEKCSLKCRDCANLMQYYAHPEDVDFKKLFDSLDILMQCVDHVLEFRVLGGETFMNRHAHEYINRLRKYENYTRIAVYSNGVIVPKGENLECLVSEDTYLRVSDYGPLSRKMREMLELFDSRGIIYSVMTLEGWQDCAKIFKRERTRAELESVYSCCCAKNTLTLLDERVYVCPFAANAANLGALPQFQDSIPVTEKFSTDAIKERLFRMLRASDFFSACQYCAGRPLDSIPLPPAIQSSEPLPYVKL